MEELIKVIAEALVTNPEAIQITRQESESAINLTLKVSGEDMGKVIGKQGRIAKAIRTVVKAAAAREGKKVFVDITQ